MGRHRTNTARMSSVPKMLQSAGATLLSLNDVRFSAAMVLPLGAIL